MLRGLRAQGAAGAPIAMALRAQVIRVERAVGISRPRPISNAPFVTRPAPPTMPAMSQAYDRLREFLDHKMRMSHVYQPVMLQVLLGNGGSASIREIATAFLAHDRTQAEYYEQVVKKMPRSMRTSPRRHVRGRLRRRVEGRVPP